MTTVLRLMKSTAVGFINLTTENDGAHPTSVLECITTDLLVSMSVYLPVGLASWCFLHLQWFSERHFGFILTSIRSVLTLIIP